MTDMALEWTSVLQSHRGWLRSVVAARVTESDGVEEVWQEICLAALRSRSQRRVLRRSTPQFRRDRPHASVPAPHGDQPQM